MNFRNELRRHKPAQQHLRKTTRLERSGSERNLVSPAWLIHHHRCDRMVTDAMGTIPVANMVLRAVVQLRPIFVLVPRFSISDALTQTYN